jgi:hypothetical protein
MLIMCNVMVMMYVLVENKLGGWYGLSSKTDIVSSSKIHFHAQILKIQLQI